MKSWSQSQDWLIAAGTYPCFCSMKRLEVLLLTPGYQVPSLQFVRFPQQLAHTCLYTWVERGTVGVKCLAQEHNTMFPARARTWTTHSGVERTNHETITPSSIQGLISKYQIGMPKVARKALYIGEVWNPVLSW